MNRFLRILRVGLPGGLEYIHYAAYEYIIYLFVLRRFSSMYLMVFEIKEDIGGITETFVVGMCLLLVDRIGLAVGSGDKERLRQELKYSWLVCIGIAFVLGMMFIFLYPQLVDLFLGDIGPERAEVIHHSAYFLICTCIGLPFYVANNVFTSVYEVRECLSMPI